jgi:hypothetical protein
MGGQTYDDGSDEVKRTRNGGQDAGKPDAGTEPGSPSCNEQAAEASMQLQALASDADLTCTSDEDCVTASLATDCTDTCAATMVVSVSAFTSVKSGVEDVNATVCRPFLDDGCHRTVSPCPAQAALVPACEAGQCVNAGASPAPTCDELSQRAASGAEAIQQTADTSCDTAADCVLASAVPSCVASCGATTLVNVDAVDSVDAAVRELTNTVCTDFDDAGCMVVAPGCTPLPPWVPACEDNQCVSVYTASPAECEAQAADAKSALNDEVAALDLSCSTDEDCTAVATERSCADECGRVIVGNTSSLADGATSLIATACESFDAAGCRLPDVNCVTSDPITETHCEAGQCALGPAAVTGDCFGPEQNLDRAYDGSIPGCPCENVGDICVDGAALICDGGTWNAVIDGPCYPDALDLGCDGRVASAQTCVELFDQCSDLDNGRFCGSGRRTSLCDDGQIVESSSDCLQDSAYCVELENGLYCTGSDAGGPIDPTQCEGRGGQVFTDLGDGSLTECPNGRATLASVSGCIEGCLCCGFAP